MVTTHSAAALWVLDDVHGSALEAWNRQGRPLYPSAAQFAEMRNASELSMASGFPRPLRKGETSVQVAMRTPSVALLHICTTIRTGAPATSVKLHRTTTPGTTVVSWKEIEEDAGRCIAKYIVEIGPDPAARSTGTEGGGGGTAEGAAACCAAGTSFRPLNDWDPMGYKGGTIFTSWIHAAGAGSGCEACCYRVTARDYYGALQPASNITCHGNGTNSGPGTLPPLEGETEHKK